MTTVIQKLSNILVSPVGSLEWGSHRAELGLGKHIAQEQVVGRPEQVDYVDPVTSRPHRLFLGAPVVYRLSDVTFHPALGAIRFDGFPIKESLPFYYNGPFIRSRRRQLFSARPSEVSTAINLQTNYYHFLLEDLPRLILLKREVGLTRVYCGLYRRPLPNFMHQLLRLLDIDLVQVRRPLALQDLWFTGKLGSGVAPTQFAVSLLRDSFVRSVGKPAEHIYVSRKSSQRNFFDEESLQRSLEEIGFCSVQFEQMEFSEQVSVMGNARIVIAPHGAGLANSVFMTDHSDIVEITSTGYLNPVFEVLSGKRINYHRVLVPSEPSAQDVKVDSRVLDLVSRIPAA